MVGLLLLAAETFVPVDFFVFFLGVAALGVAAIAAAGAAETASAQLLWFSILSVGALVGLRRPILARFRRAGPDHASTSTLVGECAVLLEDLAPGAVGKAELRGTTWSVRHDGGEGLPRGHRCRVARVEGLTLWVCPE